MKYRIKFLEKLVTPTCLQNEMDCYSCPMKSGCDKLTRAETDSERVEALEEMRRGGARMKRNILDEVYRDLVVSKITRDNRETSIFYHVDGGFSKTQSIEVKEGANTDVLFEQNGRGMENANFSFYLYDYNTNEKKFLGYCYFKTGNGKLTKEVMEDLLAISTKADQITDSIFWGEGGKE